MPDSPNKLSHFWQELKRRKVTRVITVYAAASFVILELVSIIVEPLKLPEWTLPMIIVLICVGFIIAVILSWIYDVDSEGGLTKTEPVDKVKPEEISKSSSGWKIASYISFAVIVGLIVLNIIPRANNKKEILDKSIAVLPFIDDSPEKDNEHIINGIMDDLLINLQSIQDLRVPGRTSTEQYRNNPKPIPEIAAEMNVAYIVEGSGQRYGDKLRLRVQLVEGATDRHIWADSYDEVINGPEDIFRIQSRLAESIAKELQAVITPEEIELIESVPTTNLTAYDFYQRGNEAYWNYWSDNSNKEALERAEYFFNEALRYDSTFAQAYTGLARIFWGSEGYFSENWLDTARVLLDKALLFDPGLAEAHTLSGRYFNAKNDTIMALREFDIAISLNPNDWEAYYYKADIDTDYINKISNRQKAVLLNRGSELPILLESLSGSYDWIGFYDKAMEIAEEVLKLTGDSAHYLLGLGLREVIKGNYDDAFELLERAYALDTTNGSIIFLLSYTYDYLGEKEQAVRYGKMWMELTSLSEITMHRAGYIYWLQGLEKEADYYFNLQIEYCIREIELQRRRATERNLNTYYNLAATYAITGETEKALENLRHWLTREVMDARMLWLFKTDVLLNPIRDHPEFQQIVRDAEARYQAEHERVRQWLEENDML